MELTNLDNIVFKYTLKLLFMPAYFYFRALYFIFKIMPQLIPFFFLNQLSFSFLTLLALIYIFSKYILPLFTFQQVIRMYITKLSKKA